jgi:tetratricopeptide (TPR) repeat protein
MIAFPLTIRLPPSAVHAPAAWFIPGDDPQVWLEEIALWGGASASFLPRPFVAQHSAPSTQHFEQTPTLTLPRRTGRGEKRISGVGMSSMRMYVLPTSLADRTPLGVLVLIEGKAQPTSVLRGQPYGCLGGRLYLPADAVLAVPVSEQELRQKLHLDLYVLHPSAGLIGFNFDEALSVADLLIAPQAQDGQWDRAVPGPMLRDRLIAVEAADVPSTADIVESGRDDIGSEASDALTSDKGDSSLAKAARMAAVPPAMLVMLLGLGPLKFLQWLQNALPKKPPGKNAPGKTAKTAKPTKAAGGASWLRGLQGKLAGALAAISRSLLDARTRELERLKRLLQDDPDQGLRYALPLRDIGGRGRASPGWRLGLRDTSFSLSMLFGGGRAADAWFMPPDMHQTLLERYRAAANRELRLGRYRCAAYVFGHLLGDFSAAANALEQGRFYREAAILYRDQLHNPRKAAECLERGGLLPEAIVIYDELKLFEKAGDLHAQIEQPEEAARCYRQQVAIELNSRDFLTAAKLLESKLHVPDEALKVLTDAWPDADASGACLSASFQLLARLGRHDQTTQRIKHFRSDRPIPRFGAALSRVLAETTNSYPDENVRELSADAARVVAGRLLGEEGVLDPALIARSVSRTAPQDRLLARDVERFINKPRRKPAVRQMTRAANDPVVLRRFSIGEDINWKTAVAVKDGFYALGPLWQSICLIDGRWDGRIQRGTLNWQIRGDAKWSLHPLPNNNRNLTTWPMYPANLPNVLFGERGDVFPERTCILSPAWMHPMESILALAHSENGVTWILRQNSLDVYRSENGALLASHALPEPPPQGHQPLMVARSEQLFASWGQALLTYGPVGGVRVEPMPRMVRQIAVTAPFTRLRIAVAFDEGGTLIWEDGGNKSFGDGLIDPLITFTRGGFLVAAAADIGRVYRTAGNDARKVGEFSGPGAGAIALTPTDRLDEFALFTSEGKVSVYKMPMEHA